MGTHTGLFYLIFNLIWDL
jgi:hypothetical protein